MIAAPRYNILVFFLFSAMMCHALTTWGQVNRKSSRATTDSAVVMPVGTIVFSENGVAQSRGFFEKPSALENDIILLEGKECAALNNRDMLTLQLLWDRDFTIPDTDDKLLTSVSTLPYYVGLSRWVKDVFINEDIVTTKGSEQGSFLKDGKTVSFARDFSHIWMKKNDSWKLVGVSY